jgi:hypothetical protein
MREDIANDHRIFDGGDHLQLAATRPAVFDADIENAFEEAGPPQPRRCFMCAVGRMIAGFLRWAPHQHGQALQ